MEVCLSVTNACSTVVLLFLMVTHCIPSVVARGKLYEYCKRYEESLEAVLSPSKTFNCKVYRLLCEWGVRSGLSFCTVA